MSHSHSPSSSDAISPGLRPGHGGSGASCSIRAAVPAAAHAAGDAPAVPDRVLTGRFAEALNAAGLACTAGATVTTDAPYRTTGEEIRVHRANGVRSQEMEAAALFALGQVRGLPVASAVVIDGVPDHAGTEFRMDLQRAGQVLRDLFAATIAFLAL